LRLVYNKKKERILELQLNIVCKEFYENYRKSIVFKKIASMEILYLFIAVDLLFTYYTQRPVEYLDIRIYD